MFTKSRLAVLYLLIICVFVSGCGYAKEPDEVFYVSAVGLDKSSIPGMTKITYQLAIGESQDKKEAGKKSQTITLEAKSLAESRNLLNSLVAFNPTLTHIKAIVIGEDLAREGLGNSIAPAVRFREYRGSMFVFVVNGTAQEFLNAVNPIANITPSKFYELIMTTRGETSYYLNTSLHQLYLRLKSSSAQPYATLVGIKSTSKQPKGKTINQDDKTMGYEAGQILHESNLPVEFAGTAVFSDDKMVGKLNSKETMLMAMLLGTYQKGYFVVTDPLAGEKSINMYIRASDVRPKITSQLIDGKVKMNATVFLEGEITAIPSEINYEAGQYSKILEEHVKNMLTQEFSQLITTTQRMNSDVVGFGYYIRNNFSRDSDFRAYDWNSKYKDADISVKVDFKIRESGLMIRSVPKFP